MAFFNKAGNILRQSVRKHMNHEMPPSNPSIFQMIRCMSSSTKLFIGGLSYNTDDMSLGEAFNKYGEIVEARVIVDRETGRSRGFGFVTFTNAEAASAAIQALDGQELHGRRVRVNHANDRPRGPGYGAGAYGQQGGYWQQGGYGGQHGGYEQQGGYGGQQGGYGQQGVGDGYPTGGNYANTNSYDSQNVGVAGGAEISGFGGNDGSPYAGNYPTGNSGSSDSFGFGSDNQNLNSTGSGNSFMDDPNLGNSFMDDPNLGNSLNNPLEGNYRDGDDEPDDYANRRA